jgi:hypothetical protein
VKRLLIAALNGLAVSVAGQPADLSTVHSVMMETNGVTSVSTNDKEKGRKCWKGTCTECTKDCSKTKTKTRCYLCVAGQCSGNVELEAQKFCDDPNYHVTPDSSAANRAVSYREGVLVLAMAVTDGEDYSLTVDDVRFLDAAIVQADTSTSKIATATLLEAWDNGQVASEAGDLIGEIHFGLIVYGGDMPAADTARAVYRDSGFQGFVELDVHEFQHALMHAVKTSDPAFLAQTTH